MWLRNKEFFKSYAKQNRYFRPGRDFRFTVFIAPALGNKEKFLKTHLNSQSYCLRKVPGQTCEAGFRGTCFQASRSDSIHSCDLLCFSLAAVLATLFKLSPVRHFQLRVNCRLKKELPCERGCLDLTSWVDGTSTEREKSWSRADKGGAVKRARPSIKVWCSGLGLCLEMSLVFDFLRCGLSRFVH